MKLNHLNLTVTDAKEAGLFLEKYFGLETRDGMKMSSKFTVLFDESDMVLTLIQSPEGEVVSYPSSFHIGFIQSSPEKVDEINQRLLEDGFEVDPPARLHGAWTFYFTAPGGYTIEVLG
jgi:catechol 2,3-dioxygenase-like lactoylglutathione lyase family enzyme